MKKFLTLVLLTASALCATDVQLVETIAPARQVSNHQQAFAPQAPLSSILELLDEGVDPRDIMIVSDLDGTITTDPGGERLDVKSRGEMANIVSTLHELGLNIVISSAWNDFSATRTKIRNLMLENDFLTQVPAQVPLANGILKGADTSYHHDGLCCSVRLKDSEDQVYFRNKAFAPYIVFGEDICDTVAHVFFLDDSQYNTEGFNRDVQNFDLFKNAKKIDIFLLTNPVGSSSRRENNLSGLLQSFKEKLSVQNKNKNLRKRKLYEILNEINQDEFPKKKMALNMSQSTYGSDELLDD